MIVKSKTVMRGRGERAVITIQIVTPVVNALHASPERGKITTPENLLCWQQQFNDFLHQTTNYIACRLWMYSAVECRLHRVDGQYWWKWKLLIHSIALSTNISSSSSSSIVRNSNDMSPRQNLEILEKIKLLRSKTQEWDAKTVRGNSNWISRRNPDLKVWGVGSNSLT